MVDSILNEQNYPHQDHSKLKFFSDLLQSLHTDGQEISVHLRFVANALMASTIADGSGNLSLRGGPFSIPVHIFVVCFESADLEIEISKEPKYRQYYE